MESNLSELPYTIFGMRNQEFSLLFHSSCKFLKLLCDIYIRICEKCDYKSPGQYKQIY